MKKKFKPFWSYDVQNTEHWLTEMAERGYPLKKLNRMTRMFYFEEKQPETLTYRISFEKIRGAALSRSLQEEGWRLGTGSGNWKILQNQKPAEQIKTIPVRQEIVTHNQKITFVFYGLLFYLTGMLLANISMLLSSWKQDGTLNIVPSPWWSLTFTFLALALLTIVLAVYSIVKITKSNKAMAASAIKYSHAPQQSINRKEEKNLKQSGALVKKVKLGWMYAPDKLENWLEEMERRGFQLRRVGKLGNLFYFIKGEPRHMSYHAEYVTTVNNGYIAIHQDAGWRKTFESISSMEKWVIWSQEYQPGEEKPQIYTEGTSHLNRARRMALTYTILFLPVILIYLSNINRAIHNGGSLLDLLVVFACVMFVSFIFRMWAYYRRLKKHYAVYH